MRRRRGEGGEGGEEGEEGEGEEGEEGEGEEGGGGGGEARRRCRSRTTAGYGPGAVSAYYEIRVLTSD